MNVPKLRFKEFTDEWKQTPLNLFTNIYGGYAFKSENLLNYKSKYQIIKMGNVNNNTLNLEKNPSYLNTISQKELPYLLEKNDIILTLTGTFGKKDFGYSYQIKNETNLLLNQRLAVFKITNSNYSANFLKYILLNNTFLNKFFRFSVGGTGNQANISIQDIKSFKIPFPKLEEQEKIKALDLGANDYVVKPFYMGELLSRIRVAKRLSRKEDEEIKKYQKDYLEVDFISRKVLIDQEEIHLTPIEFNLLKLLIEHRGKVLTHNYIQKEIWGYQDHSNQNALRVFMATLRRKIEKDTNHPRFIVTEVGVGYYFKD